MRRVVLILGKQGEGKTTLAKRIRELYDRSITFDPRGEYEGTIFTEFLPAARYIQERFDSWKTEKFQIVLRLKSDRDVLAATGFMRALAGVLVVLEETEIYLNPKSPNRDIIELIRYGRHEDMSLLCVARHSMEFSSDLRFSATSIYTFMQDEPYYLKILSKYGIDPEAVKGLPSHRYLCIRDDFLKAR